MNGKETLALVGVVAAIGGSVEAGMQFNTMASARAQAITIETCGREYDTLQSTDNGDAQGAPQTSPIDFATLADWHEPQAGGSSSSQEDTTQVIPLSPGHYVVTKETIQCLQEGWIQNGETVDTSNIEVGEPESLLRAYAKLEQSRGENFDPSSTLVGMLGGAAAAGIIAFYIALAEEGARQAEQRKKRKDEKAEKAAEEARERGIYDYETDGYVRA